MKSKVFNVDKIWNFEVATTKTRDLRKKAELDQGEKVAYSVMQRLKSGNPADESG